MAFISPNWTSAQLAQANGLSPGLADYMLQHNTGLDSNPANQQFYNAAGFTNPAGSRTMLNQAGRNWLTNNNQTYGNINADAGQPNGRRLQYGMTLNGTPYSFSMHDLSNNPALAQWVQHAQGGDPNLGQAPQGVTMYGQFQSGGQTPNSNTTMATLGQNQQNTQVQSPTMSNMNGLYNGMYTGYGNTNIAAPTGVSTANAQSTGANAATTNNPVAGTAQYQSPMGQGAIQQVGIPNGGFSPVTSTGVTSSSQGPQRNIGNLGSVNTGGVVTSQGKGGGGINSPFMQNLNHVLS